MRVHADAPGRILFVSDAHIRRSTLPMADTLAKQAADLQPQLVLLGGDYGEFDDGAIAFFERMGEALKGVPMFAVPGNNDDCRFKRDRNALFALMRKNGVTPLVNECARITLNGKAVEIAGADDAYRHEPSVKGLFSKKEGVYRIILSHEPLCSLLEEASPDLMLSGHTHGGQINVLGLTCYALFRYEYWLQYTHLAGEKRVGDTLCVVSRGIGTSKWPIRFGAQSEIHLID